MSRTITAMFDSRSEAEAAREQLRTELGAEARIIDKSSTESTSGSSSGSSGGFWADLKEMFVADNDRSTYEEGVSRGHFLLLANVSEDQADRACSLLDQGGSVDFDQRQEQWRGEGWTGSSSSGETSTGSQASAFGQTGTSGQDSAFGQTGTSGQTSSSGQMGTSDQSGFERGNVVEEESIPIVQEQLRVGKREVERGGARVRSYVEERPVSEQVNLREEHVSVERRPVDQPISAAELGNADFLQDRTIEMHESAEEAVVSKEARVTEEVVMRKTADDHSEQVSDTVRSTHVDVDEGLADTDRSSGRDTDRGAFGFEEDRDSRREFDTDTNNRR